ncbi:MAG: ORF6N domain-containing protein [Candidatus Wallbacteria bacterium]|nr:ORF6N domain-containing protein [Candidatus Wallbacteria bacterium]
MEQENKVIAIPDHVLEQKIYLIRGKKVMLDRDLAELYDVPTKVLNQAVKRNQERFPEDFVFQLNKTELKKWKSQFVTSNSIRMGIRKRPIAFTELGVAMLSSVLNSRRAILVNISIMRVFVKLREYLATHKELRDKLSQLEGRVDAQDQSISTIIDAIKKLLEHPTEEKRKIGFRLQARK